MKDCTCVVWCCHTFVEKKGWVHAYNLLVQLAEMYQRTHLIFSITHSQKYKNIQDELTLNFISGDGVFAIIGKRLCHTWDLLQKGIDILEDCRPTINNIYYCQIHYPCIRSDLIM